MCIISKVNDKVQAVTATWALLEFIDYQSTCFIF